MRPADPVLAIVGRPNVGKSRMFNTLIGRRDAIVENTPGVTRDRNYGRFEWYGRFFTLVDTGGFDPDSEDILLERMREQAQLAIEEADVILFMVDAQVGMMMADEAIAKILRTTDTPIYIGVNKCDTPSQGAILAAEFYALGFEHVFPVSAEHGHGVDDLMDTIAEPFPRMSPDEVDAVEAEVDDALCVAVVGKPNAGKSTLVNRLLGAERLLTSNIPGTTRDAIDTLVELDGRQYRFVDTAGIRRKRSISLSLERFSVYQAIKSMERASVVLLLVDAGEGMTDQDARIAKLALDRGKSVAILLNKWDAMVEKSGKTFDQYVKNLHTKYDFTDFLPILSISALTGKRVDRILEVVDRLEANAERRVKTPDFMRDLKDMVARHQPPVRRNKRVKFYYGCQVAVRPPTFVLQVNEPKAVDEAYRRYMINQIRERYPFEGQLIKMILRKPKGRHAWNEAS